MYQSIQEIAKALDDVEIHYRVDEDDAHHVLITNITSNIATYKFLFVKTEEKGNDVGIRIIGLASYPREKWMDVYKLINSLQQEYRFVKFRLDEDGDLMASYDLPQSAQSVGKCAVEMLLTLGKVLDECYPELKRLQWA